MGSYEKYRSDGWRWRFRVTNEKVIAVSSEAYVHERDCDHSIEIMKWSSTTAVKRV
jgi:uncharacterized protein YegP (UPF0339 family)